MTDALKVRFRCSGTEVRTGEIVSSMLGSLAGDIVYVVRCLAGIVHIVPESRIVQIHPTMERNR